MDPDSLGGVEPDAVIDAALRTLPNATTPQAQRILCELIAAAGARLLDWET